MKNLKGKVAFVTGGSRGIGAGIVRRLSADGADVVFTHSGKNPQAAEKVLNDIISNGRKGLALEADSGDTNAVSEALKIAVDRFGAVDILVNNAGIYMLKGIEDYSLEEFDLMINVNVKAVFAASQFAARNMKNGGRIITIGSNMAERVASPGGSLYALSKSALIGLTKGLARDLGSRNIAVNLVQPGPVNTDMNPEDSDFAAVLKSMTALGRYGKVEEIAGLVSYLSSEDGGFITGASLTIDGGYI